eukprot:TRINITY_DN5947_c0_g1_i1.p1 TRINITY_DN5947_c0_g1~~TRINITY_DN5947_c0_g1_i1.p1  ORF type:complete len:244 (+),score=50.59 TRINITY_DN5947_c0_g1_i1:445-1176(+)
MLGPIVDNQNTQIRTGNLPETFRSHMWKGEPSRHLKNLVQNNPKLSIGLVPSLRDAAIDHFAFPQPAFVPSKKFPFRSGRFHLLPNPALFRINKIVIGAVTTDILMHISAKEVSRKNAPKEDRITMLCRMVIQQRCFYPLNPPAEGTSIDSQLLSKTEFFEDERRPDILLFPSDLEFFIKEVDGVLCINPGRLCKGTTGGTYCSVIIGPDPLATDEDMVDVDKDESSFSCFRRNPLSVRIIRI